MRRFHNTLRFISLLLAGAALAACDQRGTDVPTGTQARPGGAGAAPLVPAGSNAIPGRYVVVMQDGQVTTAAAAAAHDVVAAHGGRVHHMYSAALNGFAAELSPAGVDALRHNPQVKYVAEDAIMHADQTTQPGATWGLDRVDQHDLPLNTTYVYGRTGTGVRVYVIDTGIRTAHVEFGGRASVGTDLVNDGQNGQDCHGHGTHVAGTIGGTTYGVAKNAQLIAVRVLGCDGNGTASNVLAGIDWVTANAVKPAVANMSLSGSYYEPINTAVTSSIASGVAYVVAAGNDGADACGYSPASTPQAITVGATSSDDARSSFSNRGTCVDLFAPGSGITSAWSSSNTAIDTLSGTSMAAPHAAGVAALYLQGNPTATAATVAAALVSTSTPNRVTDAGTGSPNRLLFSLLTLPGSGGAIELSPSTLSFTFVRPISGAAALHAQPGNARAQTFLATSGAPPKKSLSAAATSAQVTTEATLSGRVTLANHGAEVLDWTATSNRDWLSMDPGTGRLNTGYIANLSATARSSGLAAGTHTGTLTVAGPVAADTPRTVDVTVNVVEPVVLVVGATPTGLAGAQGSQRHYAVQVPAGATSLRIAISGGTGDADLYLRYGDIPTPTVKDCASEGSTNEDSCQVASPLPGTYYVMVLGSLEYSGATLGATTGGPPAAPLNPAASPLSTTSVRLTWTDGSVNETGFVVGRRTMAETQAWGAWADVGTPAANATSFADTGLMTATNYQYRLRSCNAAGCSPWVDAAPLSIPDAPPSPPFNLVARASGTAVILSWTDGSSDETSFKVARRIANLNGTWSSDTTIAMLSANTTSFTNTDLLPNRSYLFRVFACNPVGCSAAASSGQLLTPTVPAAPSTVSGTPVSVRSIKVQWTDASTNESSFTLERATVGSDGVVGAFALVATLPANQVVHTDAAVPVGTYRYRVQACSAAGCSAWATTGNLVIPPVPPVPASLTAAELTPTSIRLTWVDGAAETEYQVYRTRRNLDGTWPEYLKWTTLPANTVRYDDAGLSSGWAYRYQVRACNISGCATAVSNVITTP